MDPGLPSALQPRLIKSLAEGDHGSASRWDAFVARCAQATFFHRSAWQGVISATFGHRTHYLYAERAGRIEAVLPLVHVRSLLFGNALVSIPFGVYGGVAAEIPEAGDALENEAQALAERLGVDHLELRNVELRQEAWPTQDLY